MKCAFGKRYVEYLGHIIGDGKLAIPEHRASAMLDFKLPKTKKQLRSFLGGMSYYRIFIPHCVSYSSILSPANSKGGKCCEVDGGDADSLQGPQGYRQLQGAQRRYSATELECFAIFKSAKHVAHY